MVILGMGARLHCAFTGRVSLFHKGKVWISSLPNPNKFASEALVWTQHILITSKKSTTCMLVYLRMFSRKVKVWTHC